MFVQRKMALFVALFNIAFLVACQLQVPAAPNSGSQESQGVTGKPANTEMQNDPATAVVAFHESFNAYDVEKTKALVSEDFELKIIYGGTDDPVFQGQEGLAKLVGSVKEDHWQTLISNLQVAGNRITADFVGLGDQLRQVGVPEYGKMEATVEDGLIQSLVYTPAPANNIAYNAAEASAREKANLAIVQRFYDEFAAGTADVILEVHPDKLTMHYAGESEEVDTKVLRDDLAAIKAANPDLHAEIHSMFASGDIVVTELTWTATHKGDFFDIPATGETVLHNGIVVRRLEDGKIVESWEIWDDLAFLQSIGYLPSWEEIIAKPPSETK